MRIHRKHGIPKPEVIAKGVALIQRKMQIFASWGYRPHIWALAGFHANYNPETGRIARFRFLVAGRRGGKSFSAAREVLVYVLYPEIWWEEVRGIKYAEGEAPGLWAWIVARDHVQGWPTYVIWKQALDAAGLIKGVDYYENKTYRRFTFPQSGSIVEFKTAEDPDKLVGAGLHIIWWDEAAKIRSRDAWDKARPTLADFLGIALFTTTPEGKDWVWEEGDWNLEDGAQPDPDVGTVEFYSIDNPYFPKQEWLQQKRRYHPMLFKQQYMASFDAMQGKDLHAEWLHYYGTEGEPQLPARSEMFVYLGVDPAISQRKGADNFVISAIGVDKKTAEAYLIEQWGGHLGFPDQVSLITEWHKRWKPEMIGIESQAYQAALVQQIATIEGFPPVTPVQAHGTKAERIISMSPLFRFERMRVLRSHKKFIEEWVDFDSSKTDNRDDHLDSVQIALSVAGAVQPEQQLAVPEPTVDRVSPHAEAARSELQHLRERVNRSDLGEYDEPEENWTASIYDEEYG